VTLTRKMRDECTVSVGTLQISRPFGKPMRRFGYIIMDLQEIQLECVCVGGGGGGGGWG
jgi:hypothetical protein